MIYKFLVDCYHNGDHYEESQYDDLSSWQPQHIESAIVAGLIVGINISLVQEDDNNSSKEQSYGKSNRA